MRNHILVLFILIISTVHSQTFEKITDSSNPVVTFMATQNYSGGAWIDYNNDGLMDLFVTDNFLFKNTGNGNFEAVSSDLGSLQTSNLGTGTTWADFDNDGDLDCFIAGNPSVLYRNDGDDQFVPDLKGSLSLDTANRGWAAAWGDYNNDGFTDLIVTHPAGFVGPALTSHFFINNGRGELIKFSGYEFSQVQAPYTVATWSDYDLDGDLDLFIGTGPASGTPAKDYLYENQLAQTDSANLVRITGTAFSDELQDGQVWNWIDYDNDGDLDGFVTNYGATNNHFYVNNNGTYTSVTNALTISGQQLANTWGDIDNDGDLDVITTGDKGGNGFFINNGDGSFTRISNKIDSLSSRSATFGDYDNDGHLDLFLTGAGNNKGLYHNITDNSNHWILISLTGTVSNKAAIGAKVRVKATIAGKKTWQFREVSAQNSFNGMNSLRVHFGLAESEMIDSLIVQWPSGNTDIQTGVSADQILSIKETVPEGFLRANFKANKRFVLNLPAVLQFSDLTEHGDGNPVTSWEWDFNNDGTVDATTQNPQWQYDSVGIYSVKLNVSDGSKNDTIIYNDFITVQKNPGSPVLLSYSPTFSDTTIERFKKIDFSVDAMDTTGYDLSYSWTVNGSSQSQDNVFNYTAAAFRLPRTDTVIVDISNGYKSTQHLWIVHVVVQITGIEDGQTGLPDKFTVSQNYPNPFNPSTTIRYTLPQQSHVKVKIFNVLGNEIRGLVNGEQSAGYKNLVWDGLDNHGNAVSSGIYFYKITASTNSNILFQKVKRMLLIK